MPRAPRPGLEELEPRLLYAGDAALMLGAGPVVDLRPLAAVAAPAPVPVPAWTPRTPWLLADRRADDWDLAVADLQAMTPAGREPGVLLLEAGDDPVAQVRRAVEAGADIAELRLWPADGALGAATADPAALAAALSGSAGTPALRWTASGPDPDGGWRLLPQAAAVPRIELVFVDAALAGDDALREAMTAAPQGVVREWIVLDGDRPGLEQVTEALGGRRDIAAVHLLSHGAEGRLQLGSEWIDAAAVADARGTLAGWAGVLAPDADLLLYACDSGAGAPGAALLEALADSTGADVAASTDRTGDAARGGDWSLEASRGGVATVPLAAPAWQGLLAAAPVLDPAVSPTLGVVPGGATNPGGVTVADLVVDGSISDPDGSAVEAIAVTGLDTSLGTWQFSIDGGVSWLTIDAAQINSGSNELALLLVPTTRIRLLPFGELSGTLPGAITFRAWDMSSGTSGEYVVLTGTGGASAFSSASDTASVTVTAVNDAPTFAPVAGTGTAMVPVGSSDDFGYSVTVQPDGRILVAGLSSNGSDDDFSLIRLNADGSRDATFDTDGKLLVPVGSGSDVGYSLTVQPDGRILVAGSSWNGSDPDFSLIRLNPDGSLDTTFDADGKLLVPVGSGGDIAYSVTVQPDGRILVAGLSSNGSDDDLSLIRLNPDGSLDTTFDTDGKLLVPVGSGSDVGYSLTVQPDGRILVAGYSWNGNPDFSLIRLNADGSLDTTFDADGKLLVPVGSGNDYGRSVTVQPDGRILVAGYSSNGSNNDFSLIRLNPDGSLDATFDTDGKLLVPPVGFGDDVGYSVTVQPDGRILVAGSSWNGSNDDFSLIRLNADGSPDATFDADGKLLVPVGSDRDVGRSVTVQPDGRILVAGSSWNGSDTDFSLIRLNPDGSLDTTFNGMATDTLGGTASYTENGSAVVLDGDVRIFDAELSATDFNGATLTLARNGGASAQDVFSATGTLSAISAAGGNVVVGGTTIGTYTQGSGTLIFSFNGSATNALVNSAMQQIAYANTSDAPPATVQIDWTFSDGNSGAQGTGGPAIATGATLVAITAVNSPPTDITLLPARRTDLLLNATAAGDQSSPVIAAQPGGGFVAVWVAYEGVANGNGIYAQRFDVHGQRVGAEFRVTGDAANNQYLPQVAALSDGRFVVAWNEQVDGAYAWSEARVFGADGTPVTGDIAVSTPMSNPNEGYRPTVAALEGDRFIVVWQGESGNTNFGVRARLYDRNGVALGGELLIGTTGNANSMWWVSPRAAGLADGGVAVVYATDNGSSSNALLRFINADGSPRSAVIDLGLGGRGDITRLADGRVVVTWERSNDLFARIYDASGTLVVAEFQVDGGFPGVQFGPSVAADASGFTVAWTSDTGDGSGQSVHARQFTASGMPVGPATTVNRQTAGDQTGVDAARLSTGEVLLAFSSLQADGSGWSAVASRAVPAVFEGASTGTVVADVASVTDVDTGDVFTFALTDDAGGRFAIDSQTGRITVANGSALVLAASPTHTLTLRVTDQQGASLDRRVTVGVLAAIPQAPVLTGIEETPLSQVENQAASPITGALVVSDVDSATLIGATVRIAVNHDPAADVLAFTAANGITGSWDGASGTLTLSGVASVADYQAALRTVTYRNTIENPSTAPRTVTIQVNDGSASNSLSNIVWRSIVNVPVNDAPTVTAPATFTVTEDVAGNLLYTGTPFADVDSGTLTVTLSIADGTIAATSGGGVTVGGSATARTFSGSIADLNAYFTTAGTITYTSAADNTQPRTLTTQVSDGTASTTATSAVTITPVNDAPRSLPVAGAVAAYDFEDGGPAESSIVPGGPVMTVGGTVAYQAGAGRFAGSTGLRFTADDDSASAPVTIGPMPNLTTTQAFSFAGWVRFDALAGTKGWERVFDFGQGMASSNLFLARRATSDDLTVATWGTATQSGSGIAAGVLAGQVGQWMHLSVTVDSARQVTLYVNGTAAAGFTASAPINYAGWTINRIGSSNWVDDRQFRGAMDDIALFDRALSAGEVARLAATAPPQVAYTEGGAPVVLDLAATVVDAELASLSGGAGNYAGATLTLARSGGANGQDQFSATGTLGPLTEGGALVVGGATIGTVTTNSAGTLALTFGAGATRAQVDQVFQQIGYANTSDAPPPSVSLAWTFSDGNTGAQGDGGALIVDGATTVAITAVNAPPTDFSVAPARRADLILNTTTLGDQTAPVIAAQPGGGWVAVWMAPDGAGTGLFAQRFDAGGLRVGGEFRVNASTTDIQYNPQVVSFADGGFVVAWTEQRGGVAAWAEARVFAADGTPLTGDIAVSLPLNNPNEAYAVSVAVLEGDRFVVTWAGETNGTNQGVRGRLYGRDGVAQTWEFVVGATGSADTIFGVAPKAVGLADGGFAVLYSSNATGTGNSMVRFMNADGTPRSAPIDQGLGQFGGIARLNDGNVVVAFERGSDIVARVYNPSGALVVPEFQVDMGSTGIQSRPSVAADGAGFTVAWTSDSGDGSGLSVWSRSYVSAQPVGPAAVASQLTAGDQSGVSATRLSSGGVLLSFSSWRADGDGWAVVANRPVPAVGEGAAPGTVVADVVSVVDADADDVFSFSLVDDAGGRFAIDAQSGRITVANGLALDLESAPWHTVTVRVTDLRGAALERTLTVGVLSGALPPPLLAGIEAAPLAYAENQGDTPITATLNVLDDNSPSLAGATVRITANFDATSDELGFTATSGITGAWDAGTGTLTLSGSASLADYQAALRSVTYRNTSENPSAAPRTVTFQVNSGAASNSYSSPVSRSIVPSGVNDAPTGTPVIAGTAAQGQVLTVSLDSLGDVDGLGPMAFQWLRNGVAIVGATSPTYTLAPADVGASITVTASWTDGGGRAESVTSAAVGPVANVNDAPTGAPVIAGTPAQGQVLTVGLDSLGDADGIGAITVQWRRDGVAIVGATSATYTLGQADVGASITVTASWTDGGGTAESVTSAAVGPVADVNDAPTGSPVITGTPMRGEVLTVDLGSLADVDGLGAIAVQWQRNGVAIVGATSPNYTLAQADVGASITVTASWTDGGGSAESVTSAEAGPVAPLPPPRHTLPGPLSTPEDNELAVNGLSLIHPDGIIVQTTVSVDRGTLSIVPAQGVAISQGATGARSLTLTGQVAAINAALSSLRWQPPPDATDGAVLTVTSADDTGATTVDTVRMDVVPVDDPPVLTSYDGRPEVAIPVPENTVTEVARVQAIDIDSPAPLYRIAGGDDAVRFVIDPVTGALSFVEAPNRERPTDADGDGVYRVRVEAGAGGQAVAQTFAITVGDVAEAPAITRVDIVLSRGGLVVVDGAMLATVDEDTPVGNLVIEVIDARGGWFARSSAPGMPLGRFAVDDLAAGRIVFVHDGGPVDPVVRLAIDDGGLRSEAPAATVRLIDRVVPDPIPPAPADPPPTTPDPPTSAAPPERAPPSEGRPADPPVGEAPGDATAPETTTRPPDGLAGAEWLRPVAGADLSPAIGPVWRQVAVQAQAPSEVSPAAVPQPSPGATPSRGIDGSLARAEAGTLSVADTLSVLGLLGVDVAFASPQGAGPAGPTTPAAPGPRTRLEVGSASTDGDPGATLGSEQARLSLEAGTIAQAGGLALSTAAVLWVLRTGGLAAGLMASMPVWQRIDPLLIVGDRRRDPLEADADDDEASPTDDDDERAERLLMTRG